MALSHRNSAYYRRFPLQVIYNAVGSAFDRQRGHRVLSAGSRPRIGMVARLDAIKDHVTVIRALAAIRSLRSDVIVEFAGDGALRPGLEEEARRLQAIFSNGTDTVQTCLAGSVGGINWIVNNGSVATVAPFDPSYAAKTGTAWLAVSNLPASGNITSISADANFDVTTTGAVLGSPAWEGASGADFTMSDSLQASTPYSATVTGVTLVNAGSVPATAANIGVVQFVFAKGDNGGIGATADAFFTNMSALGFRNLVNNGFEQLSAFTGISSDDGKYVLLVGRDSDSGTRLATAYETGFGDVNTAMNQWKAYDSSSVDLGGAAGTIDNVLPVSGQAGYSSGGNVKTVLQSIVTASSKIQGDSAPFILVGYVGTGDIPSADRVIKYNGVTQTDEATRNGQYTFWTHEQAYYKSTLATAQKTIANAIADGIKSTYATASKGVIESTMKADRGAEGALVIRTI
ncbi:MAG: hypothetical protein WDM96_09600 [Lacunisphaera sp.]